MGGGWRRDIRWGGVERLMLVLQQRRELRLYGKKRYRPQGPCSGLLTWFGVKTERYGVGRAEEDSWAWRRRQLMGLWS